MISVGKPFVYEDGQFAYLKAKVIISADTAARYLAASKKIKKVHWRTSENYPPIEWQNDDSGLWFATPIEYKDYLCIDRSDAFIVAMLWYAMITGSDIEYVVPMSERMNFSIQEYLIPALCTQEKGYRRIRLIGPTTDIPYKSVHAVGTGMSCGVDSIYTLQEYSKLSIPEKYRLTHLTYYNMGAIFHPNRSEKKEYSLKEFYETTDRMSEDKCENARQVAELSKLPLVYVKSNLDSDYYRGAYGHTGVYRNCAMTLALQGLFSIYYCSSGGWPGYFDLTLTEGSEHYESLLCTCLSTESLSFILSDYVSRMEKTESIADNPIAHEYLDVCFCFNNCGKCSKCLRTLVSLDLLDKVHLFRNTIDTRYFENHIEEVYLELLRTKDRNQFDDNAVFARDLYRFAKEKGKIPQVAMRKYRFEKRISGIKREIKRILVRCCKHS